MMPVKEVGFGREVDEMYPEHSLTVSLLRDTKKGLRFKRGTIPTQRFFTCARGRKGERLICFARLRAVIKAPR